MSQLKNLYTHLVGNRIANISGWLGRYKDLLRDVQTVRRALIDGKDIKDDSIYASAGFGTESDTWLKFANRLLRMKNGVASRGQSVLSSTNFQQFIQYQIFVHALSELIKDPGRGNVIKFETAWENTRQQYGANANPLLINRTIAACTTDVSTTVDNAAFEVVYDWLVRQGLVQKHADVNAGWYDKNLQVMAELHRIFEEELKSDNKDKPDEYLLSIFVWELFEYISNPFTLKKQVVKYGPPGTGKTYTAQQNARLLFDIWAAKYEGLLEPSPSRDKCIKVVQFHPSYGYEDFIEGLRPVLSSNGQPQLKLQNGVFKEFCRRAGAWEIQVYEIPEKGPELAGKWSELTVGELKPHIHGHLSEYPSCPSWSSIERIDSAERIVNVIPPFFFIIDEINRAELSRVLGELMYCIEYRGTGGAISTQYTALNTSETAMLPTPSGNKFFIPHNVYIIGTMNTIDRSVESFDLALRRRFRWEQIEPDMETLRYHLNQRDAVPGNRSFPWSGLADDLASLNEAIRKTPILGRDYQIGHTYLMNLGYPATLNRTEVRKSIWEDSIKPLIEEYLRGSGQAEELIPDFQIAFGIK
jgi:5-methylcytosine-specific restriction protein B